MKLQAHIDNLITPEMYEDEDKLRYSTVLVLAGLSYNQLMELLAALDKNGNVEISIGESR